MKSYGQTDVGVVRATNEDCFGIFYPSNDSALIVVCDGMGGHKFGDVASKLALEKFSNTVLRLCRSFIVNDSLTLSDRDAYVILTNAVTRANSAVWDCQLELDEEDCMGTTLVAALVTKNGAKVSWINIGDSRLYTVTPEETLQVSKDHSYVQFMVDMGQMTSEEAKTSPKRNLITKAIGISEVAEPDADSFPQSSAERERTTLLLCTDGLHGALDEDVISSIINNKSKTLEEKTAELINTAKEADGGDNIALVLTEF